MERIPSSPPIIPALPPSADRPRWSVMIPVYNCAEFLVYTLESVLAEKVPASEMQIEVVDDASTDADVEKIVQEIGQGRVGYYRQPQNVGSLRNFETCINRARGHLVHLLHGDDRIRPGYYNTMQRLFEEFPEAGAAFCRHLHIDEQNNVISKHVRDDDSHWGVLPNWLLRISERQHVQYATITVKREVYEQLGCFYGITYGEDWEMWVRIAKHYPVAHTSRVLAEYRKHAASISGVKFLTGEYLEDISHLFRLIQQHLPPEHRKSVLKRAQKNFANYGMNVAYVLWKKTGNKKYVEANLTKALKMHVNTRLCLKAARILAKIALHDLGIRPHAVPVDADKKDFYI
ncbi:glycosyltransferase family 2 protein [Pontibacter litorisediminis]|uniref:glycosyltransferase family 2 protein n=1 Tax=Pontibacter litorisediminis TaxID=1846260 RepID=UPI0023EB5B31|nr:glycosyltransferase [Pontibacter litorisediminis]